jgi:hypothetical protein
MVYIKNSELWKYINDFHTFKPTAFKEDENYTKIQYVKIEENKRIEAEKQKVLLKSFLGRYFKCKLQIAEITEDTVEAIAGIPSMHGGPLCSLHIFFHYEQSFTDKLLTFGKGRNDVKMEGKILNIVEDKIILELTSIEKTGWF